MVGIPQKSTFPVAKAAKGEETVTLRGTSRGFELIVCDGVDVDALIGSVTTQLAKSPAFFAGSDVTIQFAGHPIPGSLGPLEEVAAEFGLTIVAIRSELESRREAAKAALAVVSDLLPDDAGGAVVTADLACKGSEETPIGEFEDEVTAEVAISAELLATCADAESFESIDIDLADGIDGDIAVAELAPAPVKTLDAETFDAVRALALQAPDAAKIIIGPVRSGCILEATEHLVVVGDVNPGAEVTSIGSIIVLGRLRGVAHAGAGGNPSFIIALQLEPQQLRLGTKVARAQDGEACGARPEIARIEGERIIVEPYAGKLPFSLASILS